MMLVDTHAHLEGIDDPASAIAAAREAGVRAILAVGSGYSSNVKTLELSRQYAGCVFPAFGLHPWELHDTSAEMLQKTLEQIEANIGSLSAIGEVGLDYDKRSIKLTTKEEQQKVLIKLLEIAARHDKPVSLHSRYAWKDCLQIVRQAGIKKAIFHWFTGFSSVLREILDCGYYISGTPAAEYHDEHRRAIREAPLEQLLLETDSPVSYGREARYRAQPADVRRSLNAVALIKNMDPDQIARVTTANANRLLNLF